MLAAILKTTAFFLKRNYRSKWTVLGHRPSKQCLLILHVTINKKESVVSSWLLVLHK